MPSKLMKLSGHFNLKNNFSKKKKFAKVILNVFRNGQFNLKAGKFRIRLRYLKNKKDFKKKRKKEKRRKNKLRNWVNC